MGGYSTLLGSAVQTGGLVGTIYRIAGKFGGEFGLAVCLSNRQIKIYHNFLLTYIRMAIPYRTANFKFANMFAMASWDPTTKLNSRQYFWLYGMICNSCVSERMRGDIINNNGGG